MTLDIPGYFRWREELAADLRRGIAPQDSVGMVQHVFDRSGLTRTESAEFVERFLKDLRRDLGRRRGG